MARKLLLTTAILAALVNLYFHNLQGFLGWAAATFGIIDKIQGYKA